jgi:hypothetical protein
LTVLGGGLLLGGGEEDCWLVVGALACAVVGVADACVVTGAGVFSLWDGLLRVFGLDTLLCVAGVAGVDVVVIEADVVATAALRFLATGVLLLPHPAAATATATATAVNSARVMTTPSSSAPRDVTALEHATGPEVSPYAPPGECVQLDASRRTPSYLQATLTASAWHEHAELGFAITMR